MPAHNAGHLAVPGHKWDVFFFIWDVIRPQKYAAGNWARRRTTHGRQDT